MNRAAFIAIASALALGACGSSAQPALEGESPEGFGSFAGSEFAEGEAEFDEDSARADAEQEVADEGYSGDCTIDCSGHDAGFAWAADGHEDRGASRSPSFDEGQEPYDEAVEERIEEKRQAFEEEGTDSDYAR